MAINCECDEGHMCETCLEEGLRQYAYLRGLPRGAVDGHMSEQDRQDIIDAGRGHLVRA